MVPTLLAKNPVPDFRDRDFAVTYAVCPSFNWAAAAEARTTAIHSKIIVFFNTNLLKIIARYGLFFS
jgi:hypothetical protein